MVTVNGDFLIERLGAQPTRDGRSCHNSPRTSTPLVGTLPPAPTDPKIKRTSIERHVVSVCKSFPAKTMSNIYAASLRRHSVLQFGSEANRPASHQPHAAVDPLGSLHQKLRARINGSSTCDSIKSAIRSVASEGRICGCATS